jgi:hypothetical protein
MCALKSDIGACRVIEHLVLFKVKAEAAPADSTTMMQELRKLKEHIPEIQEITCGVNTSNRNQGFTHGLLVRVRSQSDLEAYLAHPEHQRVAAQYIRPIIESVIVVDYES